MNTDEIFTANRIVNYFLLNKKCPYALIFLLCGLIRLYWWLTHLTDINKTICQPEVVAGLIAKLTYSFLTILGSTYYTQKGISQLKILFLTINKDIQSLRTHFKVDILLNFQRLLVKNVAISLLLYFIGFLIHDLVFLKLNLDMFDTIIYKLASFATAVVAAWIWFYTLMELTLLSIVGTQIQAMIHVVNKWDYRYAKLWVGIFQQSKLVNNVFEVITLTIIIDNFIDILLAIWSASEPKASCVMHDYQFMLILCCGWTIAIIESGQHVNKKVRTIFGC